jgi:hypothetical protein
MKFLFNERANFLVRIVTTSKKDCSLSENTNSVSFKTKLTVFHVCAWAEAALFPALASSARSRHTISHYGSSIIGVNTKSPDCPNQRN